MHDRLGPVPKLSCEQLKEYDTYRKKIALIEDSKRLLAAFDHGDLHDCEGYRLSEDSERYIPGCIKVQVIEPICENIFIVNVLGSAESILVHKEYLYKTLRLAKTQSQFDLVRRSDKRFTAGVVIIGIIGMVAFGIADVLLRNELFSIVVEGYELCFPLVVLATFNDWENQSSAWSSNTTFVSQTGLDRFASRTEFQC